MTLIAPRSLHSALSLLLLLTLLLLTACGAASRDSYEDPTEEAPFIAVVARGFEHEFWRTVRHGSLTAARELAVPLSFDGPATEEMVDVQIDLVENAVTRNADAILIAALDATALVGPVERAQSAGIPVATFDAGVDTQVVFHVGTDNRAGGRLAAERLGALIGGTGRVAVVLHDRESETGIDRWLGFFNGMGERYPEVELLSPVVGSGNPERSADLLRGVLDAHPDVQGVFASNEGSAIGAALALQEWEGDVKLVAFDASAAEIALLRDGEIDGVVAQDPFNMGYLGVQMLFSHLQGEAVPALTRTPLTYITAENLDDPGVRELLSLGQSVPR